jgi:ABC-type nitrate/sulfonate/bicarbonate transport system substrate-binding protein
MLEMHGVSRRLMSYNQVLEGYVFSGVYFSRAYLAGHGEEVRAFLRGLVRSFRFIADHEKRARTHLPKYTSVPMDVAMRSALRDLTGEGRESLSKLDRQQDLLIKFGYLKEKVSLKDLVDYTLLPKGRALQ